LDASVAQARKYGLGMMFATQAPKDNKIILNCTTQFYGKMGSETDAKTVKKLIHDKGGAADDIGKLPRGEFYFSTEGSLRPFKVRTPLCLTWHPPNPPTAEEVFQNARTKAVGSPP
jgi:DNA helicase HerA-like ATPase